MKFVKKGNKLKFLGKKSIVESESRVMKRKAGKKLMTLVSQNHKDAYKAAKKENDKEYNLYLRMLLIADYISGMTDSYAKTLYQNLSGI